MNFPAPEISATEWIERAHGNELFDASNKRLLLHLRTLNSALDPQDDLAFSVVVAALCRTCAEGSLCLPLDAQRLTGMVAGLLATSGSASALSEKPVEESAALALAAGLAARFLESADAGRFANTVGSPTAPGPLVRAHDRLYLHRFYFAEHSIAAGLSSRGAAAAGRTKSGEAVETILQHTLIARPLRAPDGTTLTLTPLQREALVTALQEPVFVLSGGPGTGKTTWTAAWLRAVLRLPGVTPDRVRLCAPTGRAARRLEESLRARLEGVDASEDDGVDAGARAVPVTTLHSLLGYRAFDGRFARGPEDPIDADWILLDEASMADVFLLSALVRALHPRARLVLAGDPDQLPAVEAGSVLAELLPFDTTTATRGTVPSVTLDAGHRSQEAVAALANAVRTGDASSVLALLGLPAAADEGFTPVASVGRIEPGDEIATTLATQLQAYARSVFGPTPSGAPEYATLLSRFRTLPRDEELAAIHALWTRAGRTRVLAPLRRGVVSAESANRLLRERLEPAWRLPRDGRGAGFHGAPILITRNDDRAGLSNGDVGLWLETGDGAVVFFPRQDSEGGWLRVPVALLPPHELGFASTVHKSQGSEYDDVLLLLPEEGNRLLTRETLYTAITRARRSVLLFGTEAAIRQATEHRMQRYSGLREALCETLGSQGEPQG